MMVDTPIFTDVMAVAPKTKMRADHFFVLVPVAWLEDMPGAGHTQEPDLRRLRGMTAHILAWKTLKTR